MIAWTARLAAILSLLALGRAAAAAEYPTRGMCDGFPAIPLHASPGLCVGLVADHLGHARGIATVADQVFVADMGGWRKGRGRLLALGRGGHDAARTLLAGLDEPSGLLAAPDGTLYLGVLGRVLHVTPGPGGATAQDLLTGLPGTGRHPLTAMALAPPSTLYINVGSGSDHCESHGAAPDPARPCPETRGMPPRASILRVSTGQASTAGASHVVATGLRNSMALAVTTDGALLAGVNERDYIDRADPSLSDAALPNDVLDVVRPGADYGWPYCFDGTRANPEYKPHDCSRMEKPTLLLPAHAAPLGLLIYRGHALPGLAGTLLITYHGYRAEGHRLVSVALDAAGRPAGAPATLVWGWSDPASHIPMAGLTGLAQLPDGSVLISDDGNGGVLLRLARAQAAEAR